MDEESGFAGMTILVADADDASRDGTARMLAPYSYDVRVAGDGTTAWSIALGRPLDLVLIDLNLVGLAGFDLLARLRTSPETSDIPVIVLASEDGAAVCDRALGLGATIFLNRPVRPAQLTHIVWYVLRNGRRDAEMRALKARLAGGEALARPSSSRGHETEPRTF